MATENNASDHASFSVLESSLQAWRSQVELDLKGADFNQRLVTRTPEGIALQPLYTRADLPSDCDLAEVPGQAPFRRGWKSPPACRRLQKIARPDAKSYHAALHEALMNGQDAVCLPAVGERAGSWSPTGLADLAQALEGVDLEAVPVYLPTGADPLGAAALYLAHAEARGVSAQKLHGAVAADPIGEMAVTGQAPAEPEATWDNLAGWIRWTASHAPQVRALGVDVSPWHDAGASAVQELGFALATLADYLREFEKRDLIALTVLSRTLVTLGVGPRFFTELAKFRAWRVLVSKLLVAMGVDPAAARELAVHARVTRWNKTKLDLHVNMLRSTTESLAAVLGGVDGLQIDPFDEVVDGTSAVGERVARNLHTLMHEEFGFMKPQDAGGGSWYIENLTDKVARGAWEVFRAIERQGGMRAALLAGWPQAEVSKIVAERDRGFATRRSGLIGSNLFPNLRDTITPEAAADKGATVAFDAIGKRSWPTCLTAAVVAVRDGVAMAAVRPEKDSATAPISLLPITPYRAAAGFECLRLRAQAVAEKRGGPPKAILLRMGPVPQHKPRAEFSAGFISVGGFAVLGKATFATCSEAAMGAIESDADIAVICSTDDTYPDLVPPIARAIRAARPTMAIVLAGQPREEALMQCYSDAGVDEFIHVKANVLDVMGRLLSSLENQF